MRGRIVDGRWPAGGRIPTKLALCELFSTSVGTMQRALNVASGEGLVYSRGRAGTFVRERPGPLFDLAVVFGSPIEGSIWHRAIASEFEALGRRGPHRFRLYAGERRGRGGGLSEFAADAAEQRLAGAVFVGRPPDGAPGPQSVRAAVVIGGRAGQGDPAVARVGLRGCPERVLAHLASAGRRKLAMICTYGGVRAAQGLRALALERGMRSEPFWLHGLDARDTYPAQRIAELMLRLPKRDRPDALYVMDDHLVADATRGVLDSGVRVGRDLDVMAHCNFPYPPHANCPVTFVGYDIRAACEAALELITDQLAGGPAGRQQAVEEVFQHELGNGSGA
jgi:hypothetical protein